MKAYHQRHSIVTPPSRLFRLYCELVILVGCVAASAFIGVGLAGAHREQNEHFDRRSSKIVSAIENSLRGYEVAGLHVH